LEDFEPLIDVPEAAEMLRIHPKTVQAMCRSGALPALRMGKYWRFRTSTLDRWVVERLSSENQSRRVSEEIR
jgi:excisionase family DNA binding protein